jgi:hypothetical protein
MGETVTVKEGKRARLGGGSSEALFVWSLPKEVLEGVVALLRPTWRGVASHASRALRDAVRSCIDGSYPDKMTSRDLCTGGIDMVLWARSQGCPWSTETWLEAAAGTTRECG